MDAFILSGEQRLRPLSPLLQINRHGAGGTKVLTVHPALMH